MTRNSLQIMDSAFYAQEQEGGSLLTLLSSLSVESPAENRLKERVGRAYVYMYICFPPFGDTRVCWSYYLNIPFPHMPNI